MSGREGVGDPHFSSTLVISETADLPWNLKLCGWVREETLGCLGLACARTDAMWVGVITDRGGDLFRKISNKCNWVLCVSALFTQLHNPVQGWLLLSFSFLEMFPLCREHVWSVTAHIKLCQVTHNHWLRGESSPFTYGESVASYMTFMTRDSVFEILFSLCRFTKKLQELFLTESN